MEVYLENDEKEEGPERAGEPECGPGAGGVMIWEEEGGEVWVGPYQKARQDLDEFYRHEVRSFSVCEACEV